MNGVEVWLEKYYYRYSDPGLKIVTPEPPGAPAPEILEPSILTLVSGVLTRAAIGLTTTNTYSKFTTFSPEQRGPHIVYGQTPRYGSFSNVLLGLDLSGNTTQPWTFGNFVRENRNLPVAGLPVKLKDEPVYVNFFDLDILLKRLNNPDLEQQQQPTPMSYLVKLWDQQPECKRAFVEHTHTYAAQTLTDFPDFWENFVSGAAILRQIRGTF